MNIKKSLIQQIYDDFQKTVYGENIEQGFSNPCFFVLELPVNRTLVRGDVYKELHTFVVHYYPETDDYDELSDMRECLFESLEYLTLLDGNKARGINISSQVIDNVLQVTVDYKVLIRRVKIEEYMEELELNTQVKG